MKTLIGLAWVVCALALVGCTDRTLKAGAKNSEQTWNTPVTGFTAPGFKSSDAKAWEAQMQRRALGQNEYSRSASGS